MMTRHYRVAGHTFAISVREELFALIGNYEPFACDGGEPLFTLIEDSGAVPEYTEVYRKEGLPYIYGRTASGNNVYEFMESRNSGMCLICSKDNREGRLIMMGGYLKEKLNRSVMIMYALATAGNDTLVLHAVVVSCEGKGYIFLGPCRTGKSTHARLWLLHVEGTKLVNDDFPVVRDGVVYGSPWSPITPCYRNVSYPIGGIVSLSQAPYNRIHRISGIEAYLNLYECVRRNLWYSFIAKDIEDSLHQTMNRLASTVPMWHLECLPDEAAARLCHDTITR
jgi:hypothetical protein